MSTQPSPSPSPTPYHPRHSQEIKPNPHPYAIKTTSTGNLTRSGSVTNKNDRSFYVPSPSPSPTKSSTPWNHVEERSGSGRHKYSRSLNGEEEAPRPLPAPPAHPSTLDSAEQATRSDGRPLSWSSASSPPFPQPSFVPGTPSRSRIRANPFSGDGFTFGSGPVAAEDNPKSWSAAELADRLDDEGDEVKNFVLENDINGRAFLRLDEGVLNAYGITSNQHRQMLIDASRTLRQRSLRSRINRQWPSDSSAPDVDGIVRSYEVEEPEDFDDNASVSSASSTSSLRDSFGSDAGERKQKYRPKQHRANSRVHGIISSLEEGKRIDEVYAHPHRNSTGSLRHTRSRSRSSASGSENGDYEGDRENVNGGDPFYYPSAMAAAGGRPLPSPPPGPYMETVKPSHTGSSSASVPASSFDFGGSAASTTTSGLSPNPTRLIGPGSPSKSPSRRPLPETPLHASLRSAPPPLSPEDDEDPFGVKDHDGAHTEMTMDQLLDLLESDNKKDKAAAVAGFGAMDTLDTVKGVPPTASRLAHTDTNTPTKKGSIGKSDGRKKGEEEINANVTSRRSKPRSIRRVEGSYTSASSLFSAVEDIYSDPRISPASSPSAAKTFRPATDAEDEELTMEELLAREEGKGAQGAGRGGVDAWFSDVGDGKTRVETVKRVPPTTTAAPAPTVAATPATVPEEQEEQQTKSSEEELSRSSLPTPPPSEPRVSRLSQGEDYVLVEHSAQTEDEQEKRKVEATIDTTYHTVKKRVDETRMLADEMRKRLADVEAKIAAMEDEEREKEQIKKEREAAAAAASGGNDLTAKMYAQFAAIFGMEDPSAANSTSASASVSGKNEASSSSAAAVPTHRTPATVCKAYTRFLLGVGVCAVVLVLRSMLFTSKAGKAGAGKGWWLLRGLLGSASVGGAGRR